MKKIILVILLSVIFVLTSCADSDTEGYTFTDALQREITVDSCDRVAAMLGSFADVWMLAGGEVVATADDAWDDFDLPLGDNVANLGVSTKPNLELLIASDPDFVIASSKNSANLEMLDTLTALGITVAYFDVSTPEDYLSMMKICTDLTGREDLYLKNGIEVAAKVEEIRTLARADFATRTDAPSALFLRASAASIRAKGSDGNVLGEMLRDLGVINIADGENNAILENLSLEGVIAENPDFIFIVQVGDNAEAVESAVEELFSSNPAWSTLDAVKNDKVYFLDKKLYNLKPNARFAEAYEGLYEIISSEP